MTLRVDFFCRPPLVVARHLLGCTVVRLWQGERLSGRIVEVEAYGGLRDPACHSIERDRRIWNLLKGPAGTLYMHRSYRYALLNVVCDLEGLPACVLIRAVEPQEGLSVMGHLRHGSKALTNGPARLVEALAIDPAWEGSRLPHPEFWFEPGEPVAQDALLQTVRIGLKRGRELPWRFAIAANPWISKAVVPDGLA